MSWTVPDEFDGVWADLPMGSMVIDEVQDMTLSLFHFVCESKNMNHIESCSQVMSIKPSTATISPGIRGCIDCKHCVEAC